MTNKKTKSAAEAKSPATKKPRVDSKKGIVVLPSGKIKKLWREEERE